MQTRLMSSVAHPGCSFATALLKAHPGCSFATALLKAEPETAAPRGAFCAERKKLSAWSCSG